ncbi:protein-tyrosine phosphatase family protein [Mastigocoleus testarum]|uniref:Protein phosphatase n=1 Tax=Mastigocoleus testarum BC008 TaxID=371196 RepID=A0A0V7ZFX8_9CYAN|nr:dual specificity protein phosphatase family protein [Mastigocoleus testarum]KST62360.1 protein phosphatase [Mastigocoleus testarum BC008]KST63110.1 protein phosphatase [Mastigocoleus testarum BC008]
MYKFAAASPKETIVFGSARPGYSSDRVNEWIKFMQGQNIKHVCCLLSQTQLDRYSDLLGIYRQKFGTDRVCWSPIEDFQLADRQTLTQEILPFLPNCDYRQNEKVVVHCSGGIGRTGHVLAAWLVAQRGFSNKTAIETVRKTGRDPYEAVSFALLKGRNPKKVMAELNALLDYCRDATETYSPKFIADGQ